MQILEHLIASSGGDEVYGVSFGVPQKEVHHTLGAKVIGGDVADGDAKSFSDNVTSGSESAGDIGATYVAPPGGHAYGTEEW